MNNSGNLHDALGPHPGDHVYLRVQDHYAVLGRSANLLDLAGSVPTGKGSASIEDIRTEAA